MNHHTQIFLSNPQALRLEYRIDEARLILWWSPRAGGDAIVPHLSTGADSCVLRFTAHGTVTVEVAG